MLTWSFLLLSICISGAVIGCGVLNETRKNEICLVNEYITHKDEEHYEEDINKDYANTIRAYGFVAVLYSPIKPNFFCIGAMISKRWVLDNCLDTPSFRYEIIKIGAMTSSSEMGEYKIIATVMHNNYEKIKFTIVGWDTRYMFAARDALVLHKTHQNIRMYPNIGPIKLYDKLDVPEFGSYAVYVFNGYNMRSKVLRAMPNECCDYRFKNYFPDGMEICLTLNQLCINTKSITPDMCCVAQPLLIKNYRLLGVMSWSTGCSEILGVDPWVFSHVGYYRQWIRETTKAHWEVRTEE